MNKLQKRRLYLIILFVFGLSIAASFILYALKQNINVFVTPSQLAGKQLASDYDFRLGGMVEKGSVKQEKNSLTVHFKVTDLKQTINVEYTGVLPDLFHEGKGVVAEGSLNKDGVFIASQVLAKHDENYMPKNVAGVMQHA